MTLATIDDQVLDFYTELFEEYLERAGQKGGNK